MSIEKSAGAIIFRKEPFDSAQDRGEKLLFLLLHYPSRAEQELGDGSKLRRRQTSSTSGLRSQKDYWDLSKGHIEKGENPEDAAKREVEEETGLKNIEFVNGFKETIKYFFKWQGENVLKFVTFYLAETPYRDKSGTGQAETVKISQEHIGYVWLPYKEALLKLTFKNAKEVLQKANDFLQ